MDKRWLPQGMVTGIGSLPHRSCKAAARFAMTCGDIPAVPSLPRRSPAEGMIVQALAGMHGFTIGQYGSIAVDLAAIDPHDPADGDLLDESYGGWRAFLAEAQRVGYAGPVKWQFVGPVTLGLALVRAGVPSPLAFDVAVRSVRSHLRWLLDTVERALPACQQIVFIDEPSFGEVTGEDFFIAPDSAIDAVSASLALVETRAVAGLHCCAEADVTTLLATGPQILSIPASPALQGQAAHLIRFLERGGIVAWGATPTAGPLTPSPDRPWKNLSALWCHLVQRGADPAQLRHQALITPECGLGTHTPDMAEQVFAITRQLGARVRDQAVATQFAFGA